jgi:hypothetical protein
MTSPSLNAFYAASKAALTRYTEALWEDACIVPPRVPAYATLRERVLAAIEPLLAGAIDPAEVASPIVQAAEADAGSCSATAPTGRTSSTSSGSSGPTR